MSNTYYIDVHFNNYIQCFWDVGMKNILDIALQQSEGLTITRNNYQSLINIKPHLTIFLEENSEI